MRYLLGMTESVEPVLLVVVDGGTAVGGGFATGFKARNSKGITAICHLDTCVNLS